jgi:CheY-like chemotaxis protein
MFSLELPHSDAPLAPLRAFDHTADTAGDGAGLILVVDDEVAIQTAMKDLLEGWGYKAIIAGSCEELLARLADCPDRPGLIICDYRLRAHENGIHVIERLRAEYNDDDIPGMLITGDTAPDRLKEAQDSGLLLLHKPVANSRLRAAITHLVREHQARREETSPPASG